MGKCQGPSGQSHLSQTYNFEVFLVSKTLWRGADFLIESKCLLYCVTALEWFHMHRLPKPVGEIKK